MLFSSIPFLYYFLPSVLIAYYLAPKPAKNMVLLLASLVFYGWGEPVLLFLMIVSITMAYVGGLLLERFKNTRHAKAILWIFAGFSLSLLGYFKYANFFIENINVVTGINLTLLKISLPIGISFYTFQLISYLIDVYRSNVVAQKNYITLATYITMFPQLIAGPIVRYVDVEKQLQERSITSEHIAYGIRRFILGLGKKILIANVLGEFCAKFHAVDDKSILLYWMYAMAVSLQIYFDFSGYSDMAIGLGSLFGFRFIENFNYPFVSKSMTEFWRRWHISLGSWFRDYVYIPLGGSRCGQVRNQVNILIVWFLTGLWHGAQWNFVLWGLYFAILLVLEKSFFIRVLEVHPVLGHVYTLVFGAFSFVLFDAENVGTGIRFIFAMLGGAGVPFVTQSTMYYLSSYGILFAVAIIGATPIVKQIATKMAQTKVGEKVFARVEPIVMIILLIVATAYLVDGSFNPFLYFRF